MGMHRSFHSRWVLSKFDMKVRMITKDMKARNEVVVGSAIKVNHEGLCGMLGDDWRGWRFYFARGFYREIGEFVTLKANIGQVCTRM